MPFQTPRPDIAARLRAVLHASQTQSSHRLSNTETINKFGDQTQSAFPPELSDQREFVEEGVKLFRSESAFLWVLKNIIHSIHTDYSELSFEKLFAICISGR
jgi:hypothetical protein